MNEEMIKRAALSALSQKCRSSFFAFFQEFWGVIIQEDLVLNWHMEYLCNELQELSHNIVTRQPKKYDLIINIPPSTTKSTICTIMYPAWLWTQDPSLRIITNSYSYDLALDHAIKSRDIIISKKYQVLFPEVRLRRDKSAKMNYETTKTGARYATSTGGTITGKHAHLIINDDPLNPGQAASDTEREKANDHTKTLSSRKVDKANTPMVTIMQRLHEGDVTGYLLSRKAEMIKHICLPAELSNMVKPTELKDRYIDGLLDPRRLSRMILDEQKIDLGSRAYSGQYDQNPIDSSGAIVKREWIQLATGHTINSILALCRNRRVPINFYIDTAYTDNKENDPTGIIATCAYGDNLLVLHACKVWLEFPELCRWLVGYVDSLGYSNSSAVKIEPKANGLSLIQQLRATTKLNIIATPSPKDSKIVRFTAAAPTIEAGRLILLPGEWNEEYLEELNGFPTKLHDEYVDITGYAIDDYHKMNKITNAEELDYLESLL